MDVEKLQRFLFQFFGIVPLGPFFRVRNFFETPGNFFETTDNFCIFHCFSRSFMNFSKVFVVGIVEIQIGFLKRELNGYCRKTYNLLLKESKVSNLTRL